MKKQTDIIKTISFITHLNLSYPEQFSKEFCYRSKNASQMLQSCHIKSFCNYLKYFKSLKSIHMIGNNIDEDAKDDLAIAVLKKYSIVEIQLEGNPIHKTRCFRLFDTVIKIRTSRKWHTSVMIDSSRNTYAYPFKYHPEALEALVNMLQYINDFDNKTCDITEKTEELDISEYPQKHDNERIYFHLIFPNMPSYKYSTKFKDNAQGKTFLQTFCFSSYSISYPSSHGVSISQEIPNTEKVSKHTITLHILAISKVLKVSSLRTTPSSSRNPPITFSMPIKNDCAHHFINLNLEYNKIENISLNGYIFDLIYLNKTADQTC